MGKLVRDGVGLAYEEAGSGAPPIVLVHDLGSDHSCFASQFEYFRCRHRVVTIDLRGHGQSEGPRGACTVDVLADDLAWLCYELGLYRPVVLGHGLGGMVALDLATRYPDLPWAIVVVAPAAASPATPVTVTPLAHPQNVPAPALEGIAIGNHATVACARVPALHLHSHVREAALPDQINLLVQEFLLGLAGRAPP
jgi:pimeloyl-ACP methyl ester carboxylesterase